MDRREPPTLSLPGRVRHEPAEEAPPRLRPLRNGSPRRRPGWLSQLGALALYAGLVIVCLMTAGATFLMVAAPTDLVREQIVAQVKARTGRTLVLAGATSFTLFPAVGVRLADVSLSAPPGMQAAPLVTIKRLAADLRLIPLLQREVVIDRLVLSDPVLELTVDAAGRRSWDFGSLAEQPATGPVRLAQAGGKSRNDALPAELKEFVRNASDPAKAGEVAGLSRAALDDLALADTRIENGTLRYTDLRSGIRHQARAINATLSLKALSSPLEIKGTFDWHDEPVRLDARLSTLKSLLDGRPAGLVAALSGRPLEASYEGNVVQRGALELEGRLSARSPSVRSVARWLGNDLPPSAGFGEGSLAGILKSSPTAISIDALVATLDGASANGTLAVETTGPRPLIKANLRISELVLDRYRATGDAPSTRVAPVTAARQPTPPIAVAPSSAASGGTPQPPLSIEDLLQRDGAPGPQVKGFLQRDGWSGEPLGLASLTSFDADARLSFGRIGSGGLRIGTTRITAVLKSGALRIDIEDAQLYEGRARGFATLDAAKPAVALAANLQVEGVSAERLLKDVGGIDTLTGKGRLALAVAGQGLSEKEIVETLSGRADITVADGAIVGWNIPQMIRGLSQGRFSGFDRAPSARTEFSELAGSFQIAAGIATTKDLRLASSELRVTGTGDVQLPARRLDLILRPKLAGNQTAGSAVDLSAFEVPIKVQGPWDRPSYAPDLKDVLRDPDKVIDAAKRLGKQIDPDGKLGGVLRGLLGR